MTGFKIDSRTTHDNVVFAGRGGKKRRMGLLVYGVTRIQ